MWHLSLSIATSPPVPFSLACGPERMLEITREESSLGQSKGGLGVRKGWALRRTRL